MSRTLHRISVSVENMYCFSCASSVVERILEKFKVKSIKIDIDEQKLLVSSYRKINRRDLIRAINLAGYKVKRGGLTREFREKKIL